MDLFPHMAVTGVLMILVGLVVRYKIGHRRFNRRSITGLEMFSSHIRGLIVRLIEGVVGILARLSIWIGLALVLAEAMHIRVGR